MNILVFSDTHGEVNQVADVALKAAVPIDAIIHAGDHYQDAWKLSALLKAPVYGVLGNCDPFEDGPQELMVTLAGQKIYITHGHLWRVKTTLEPLFYRARELKADVVVFGHSHIPFNSMENGVLFFNPGSPSRPAGNFKASFGLLVFDQNQGCFQGQILQVADFENK